MKEKQTFEARSFRSAMICGVKLTPSEKAVLWSINTLSDEDGVLKDQVVNIAQRVGRSMKHTHRLLQGLKSKGYIVARRGQHICEYRLAV